ncbi:MULTISPECIES: 4Fe-4S dicluster domain-containing protein [Klebsiella]|uniref:4Fe-4S dicluster domain-containing protein n=1 Tax=Klebsiella TaxID=570 RepID=UPI0005EE1192|nr:MULTISPECIES: 4Fe-4S dicluster domain-containing protein [Klebsiella]EKU6611071.1 4Fe-4S dicluster domain-containing protein [Klebsiella aerogenes]EKU8183347.1 4Fe-4S dicluster domain-containing protein [Klebsiella aerogenes]EKW5856255.1 4Fe-4S dicluster domain-containing protein [Klebsiella aerogenes]EKZ5855696.1 4Fe-4S dicluster domain-containing protein [Klebsiella aerogenes]EKZ6548457.1 4Fe-4S dicluster domain-containing protein [Klebsiella aerogenes]
MTHFILASSQACIGCRTCEVACALEHVAEGAEFHPRLKVMRLDTLSVPVMCHQCENAPCVGVCPTGALAMGAERVEADAERCIGCQSCVVACPFGAITIETSAAHPPVIVKCDLCEQRDGGPACVSVCPTAAISLMTGEALAALQKQRTIASASLLSL